jgi:hypothetical protein
MSGSQFDSFALDGVHLTADFGATQQKPFTSTGVKGFVASMRQKRLP